MTKWTAADIPDQAGRTFVVTGANSGLGASTARALAGAGASVVLACRDTAKADEAAASMYGKVEVRKLDLADLSSVRSFSADIDHIDVLINNAGIMAVPKGRTTDGFERQIGTNHLGHFALTGLLLAKISDRVVTMSSFGHRMGKLHLDDLNYEHRRYERWSAYGQSKLANLMFAYELQRRLAAAGSAVKSLAAHPGYASTELQSHTESFQDKVMAIGNRLLAQSADMGALPELYAATVPTLRGGEFIGPDGGLSGMRGHPRVVGSNRASKDEALAAKLWTLSEELTGVSYP
jgi:NAD(P)-dependent dehydrogenase (short-subunit alcohol dehydrogenase family)